MIAVLLPVVLILAIVVAEFLLLLLLLPIFVVMRAGYVARWPIEAWKGDKLVWFDAVRGWGASQRRMLEVADGVRLGTPPIPARRHRADGSAD